ncbi:hypothetical protein BKP35_10895 [Anaerobacillus arseniciselenatis]|uniref:Uncharacterized protein n=1 Tax=Anaerobacillus arseniciselenatis TaxID=85682 RepID=A0A1S2LJ11_9BACI|nr:hypothetical protein BKP35_10895 [Anaerobacillus arseniciselenatis]
MVCWFVASWFVGLAAASPDFYIVNGDTASSGWFFTKKRMSNFLNEPLKFDRIFSEVREIARSFPY